MVIVLRCVLTGKNYVPDESILDPQYAPPEKVRGALS